MKLKFKQQAYQTNAVESAARVGRVRTLKTNLFEVNMTEKTAVYYGKVELVPNIMCDGYVLDDGTAVLSERGTADLLDMDHAPLKRMVLNWPPKSLNTFINNKISMEPNSAPIY